MHVTMDITRYLPCLKHRDKEGYERSRIDKAHLSELKAKEDLTICYNDVQFFLNLVYQIP